MDKLTRGLQTTDDSQDAFIDGLIVEEIQEQNEARLELLPLIDMCDPECEKQLMESIVVLMT